MCLPALPLAILGAAAIGGGVAAYSASKSASASKAANASNERIAAQQAQRAETDFNRANQKQPDIAAMFARNRESMSKGIGATFLTGPQGAPVSPGMLGRTQLLGG